VKLSFPSALFVDPRSEEHLRECFPGGRIESIESLAGGQPRANVSRNPSMSGCDHSLDPHAVSSAGLASSAQEISAERL
jgi:hypothetical protein